MLIVISDLHLGDGTTAESVHPSAFHLFVNRLRELAYFASFRKDGAYKPIEQIDILLLGDIIDPIHSTSWLDTQPGAVNFVRPWTDFTGPFFARKLNEITQDIFAKNEEALTLLRRLAEGKEIVLPPATQAGQPDPASKERIRPTIKLHYMVGNHDWYYHIPGAEFDKVRASIIQKMGLSNETHLFPHDASESPALFDLLNRHKVFARHGDRYDKFNYNPETGRDSSTIGDAFAMEMLNRFPVEVQKRFGDQLPPALIHGLRRLANVRPALASSLWISGQIKRHAQDEALEIELKKVWNDLCDEFLQMPYVREQDKAFQFDMVDAMELLIKISKHASFQTMNDIVVWVREKLSEKELSFAEHALSEPAFQSGAAKYIIYGHTHHHEIISLDTSGKPPHEKSQLYINSGTWRSYFDLAIKSPEEQKFVPYQSMHYLTFYNGDERNGRKFEIWSGTFA